MNQEMKKIPVGISSCLVGDNVRYDGTNKLDSYLVDTLGNYVEYHTLCPEVAVGLGVPRQTIELTDHEGKIEATGTEDQSVNVTKPLKKLVRDHAKEFESLAGYILKARSPSCGTSDVPVANQNGLDEKSIGIFASALMKHHPNLPVENEDRLSDPAILDNFLTRIFTLHRWQTAFADKVTPKRLHAFHAEHRLLIRSHRRDAFKKLRHLTRDVEKSNIKTVADEYLKLLMRTLRIKPEIEGHLEVIEKILEKIQQAVPKPERKALNKLLEQTKEDNSQLSAMRAALMSSLNQYEIGYPAAMLYLIPYPIEALKQELASPQTPTDAVSEGESGDE